MCLSKVFEQQADRNHPGKLLAEYVSGISVRNSNIIMTDILGREITYKGKLLDIDLVNNIILVGNSD